MGGLVRPLLGLLDRLLVQHTAGGIAAIEENLENVICIKVYDTVSECWDPYKIGFPLSHSRPPAAA